MKISVDEQKAIRTVVDLGAQHGYGNLISHLVTAWARHLVEDGLDEETARKAAGAADRGYPFAMQTDLMQNGEWDETGARYFPKKAPKQRVKR